MFITYCNSCHVLNLLWLHQFTRVDQIKARSGGYSIWGLHPSGAPSTMMLCRVMHCVVWYTILAIVLHLAWMRFNPWWLSRRLWSQHGQENKHFLVFSRMTEFSPVYATIDIDKQMIRTTRPATSYRPFYHMKSRRRGWDNFASNENRTRYVETRGTRCMAAYPQR